VLVLRKEEEEEAAATRFLVGITERYVSNNKENQFCSTYWSQFFGYQFS
jgi:hypothetical protein